MNAPALISLAAGVLRREFATTVAEPRPVVQVRRISELEGLRGIAALLVVFYHLPYWHPFIHALRIVDNGLLMVQLFFVLSGFVIGGAYRGRIASVDGLLNFQLLRLGRLYPVHLIFLLFFLLVEFSKVYFASHYGIHSNNNEPFERNNWVAFVEQLLLVHSIGPTGNALSFNTPSWSIGVEFYIYLIFGLIVLYGSRYFVYIAALIALGSFALLASDGLSGGFTLFLMGSAGFFLGCLVQIVSSTREHGSKHLLTLALLATVVYLFLPQDRFSTLVIYPLSAIVIYAMVATSDGLVRQVFRSRPMAWLGRASYSIYMSHLSIIWLVSQVVRFGLAPPFAASPRGQLDAQLTSVQAVGACIAVVGFTLGVAHFVCRYVEEPIRAATRRWVDRRSDVRPPVSGRKLPE